MRSKRELGLLYRIRELKRISAHMYQFIRDGEHSSNDIPNLVFRQTVRTALLQTAARTLSIEEGKEAADLEHFGININTLDERIKKGTRAWPSKTTAYVAKSQKQTTPPSQN
jgi:hypothetical protein